MRDDQIKIIQEWRNQNRNIGFTNGCFDIIHPGHIKLLTQAKENCDKLVVALNTDASIRRLKGESRPINDQQSREIVMSSIRMVDMVLLFEEDTPYQLIEKLRPDVLIKGSDYTIDKVVGAALVQSYGGRVVLVDLVDGQSTTKTISRMQKG